MKNSFLESEVKRLAENGNQAEAVRIARLVHGRMAINRMLVTACEHGLDGLAAELIEKGADPLYSSGKKIIELSDTACHSAIMSWDSNTKCAELVLSVPGIAGKIPAYMAVSFLSGLFDIAYPYFKDRKDIRWTDPVLWSGHLVYRAGRQKGKLNKSRIYRQCLHAAGNDEDLAIDFSLFIAAVLLRDLSGLKRLIEKQTIIRFMPMCAVAIGIWRSKNMHGSEKCEITAFLESELLNAAKKIGEIQP